MEKKNKKKEKTAQCVVARDTTTPRQTHTHTNTIHLT